MQQTRFNGITSKEQNLAVRLSGKVKNFTGRGPVVIKVKINENTVNVQLKWILTHLEKKFLYSCKDQTLVSTMQRKLFEETEGKLLRAFSEVFEREAEILEFNEESLQEKLNINVKILDLVG